MDGRLKVRRLAAETVSMGLARRLQPRPSDEERSPGPSAEDLVDLGVDKDWDRVDGMVAVRSWDALSGALSSGRADLGRAWLALTSVGTGASLLLVRAAVMQTTASHADEHRLARAHFRPRGRTGAWLRRVEPDDLDAVVRVLRGPLEVPHPRDLRFTLQAPDVARVRLLLGRCASSSDVRAPLSPGSTPRAGPRDHPAGGAVSPWSTR